MNTVAAGVGADEHQGVTRPFGGGVHKLIGPGDADTHRVDERVGCVGVLKDDLAADGGDAQAVAVTADAGDDTLEQVLRLRV